MAIFALFALPIRHAAAPLIPPQRACFVAAVALIVDDVAELNHHRVVATGVGELDAAPSATLRNCEPRSTNVLRAMSHAEDERLDSVAQPSFT